MLHLQTMPRGRMETGFSGLSNDFSSEPFRSFLRRKSQRDTAPAMRASYAWLVLYTAAALVGLSSRVTSLELKWTPAEKEEDQQLPLSQRYRDKLSEVSQRDRKPHRMHGSAHLTRMHAHAHTRVCIHVHARIPITRVHQLEEKVGPEKFRELTGMAPPSTQTGTPGHPSAAAAAPAAAAGSAVVIPNVVVRGVVLASAALMFTTLWHHKEQTGFRIRTEPHMSLFPPPSKLVTQRALDFAGRSLAPSLGSRG